MFFPLRRPPLVLVLVALYLAVSYYSLVQSSSPVEPCRDDNDEGGDGRSASGSGRCLLPLLSPDDVISLELWIRDDEEEVEAVVEGSSGSRDAASVAQGGEEGVRRGRGSGQRRRRRRHRWKPTSSCPGSGGTMEFSVSDGRTVLGGADRGNCTLALPNFARRRGLAAADDAVEPLRAKFVLRRRAPGRDGGGDGHEPLPEVEVVAEAPFELTRLVERKIGGTGTWYRSSTGGPRERRNLLHSPAAPFPTTSPPSPPGDGAPSSLPRTVLVPHFKYRSQPVVLRVVADYRSYGLPAYRGDGVPLQLHPPDFRRHRPIAYVDDVALRRTSQVEMGESGEGRPPVSIRIKVSVIGPMRDVVHTQVRMGMEMAESILGEDGSELDELRYLIDDDRIYRFVLTQIVSTLHLWLDYLAFRDEVGFYVGRTDMGGVSASSVLSGFGCSLIIFLYLFDGGGTSWLVLVSIGSGVVAGGWKAWRVLRPRLTGTFPFVSVRDPAQMSGLERRTRSYDAIAVTYLSLVLYPLVAGSALYGLRHYAYTGWYSWLISNLADAVYAFGFITMCPQLYVNYRLKSVAHLPWRVFLYKIFNTFVDDIFAFLIEMPWKHRIMTLRDDVVFVAFLYQAYIYRVDMSRPNEFGYAYEEKVVCGDGDGSKVVNWEKKTIALCHAKKD